jgi:hypothetical protein
MNADSRWAAGPDPVAIYVERLSGNPIIRPSMLPGSDGENINGPSLIRAPDWIEGRLGEYYLYFAHHVGAYIRMAYADDLKGPWKVYKAGTLNIEPTRCADIRNSWWAALKHIASPDVHVDDGTQEVRMYFHGPVYVSGDATKRDSYSQRSLVST